MPLPIQLFKDFQDFPPAITRFTTKQNKQTNKQKQKTEQTTCNKWGTMTRSWGTSLPQCAFCSERNAAGAPLFHTLDFKYFLTRSCCYHVFSERDTLRACVLQACIPCCVGGPKKRGRGGGEQTQGPPPPPPPREDITPYQSPSLSRDPYSPRGCCTSFARGKAYNVN